MHCSNQQCLVAEWSGRSVTVRARARARARAREYIYMGFFLFFLSVLKIKCDKRTLSWHGVITPQ